MYTTPSSGGNRCFANCRCCVLALLSGRAPVIFRDPDGAYAAKQELLAEMLRTLMQHAIRATTDNEDTAILFTESHFNASVRAAAAQETTTHHNCKSSAHARVAWQSLISPV